MSVEIANTTSSNSTVCSTPECKATAKSILESIDFNVDPCSDFYQYTCGSWERNVTIDDFRSSIGTLEIINDHNTDVMRDILEHSYDDAYKNLLDSDDGFHTKDQATADRENFDLMKNYYDLCMNTSHIDSLGPTPIYSNIATIQNQFFPVTGNESQLFSSAETPLISQTLAAFNIYGISSLNTFYVDADDKNPDMNVVHFDQAQLALPSKEYYEDPTNLEKYKTGLNDVLYKVLGDYTNNTQDTNLRAQESKKQNFTLWTKEKVASAVDRFIAFETQLANISLKTEELQDPIKVYNPTELAQFQANFSLIDWTTILKSVIINSIKTPDIIIDRTPEYYKKLNALLPTVSLITLQEYFVIQFTLNKIYTLDTTSRAAYRKMTGDIYSGSTVEQPRWRTCVSYTSNKFPNTLGRYYTLKQFGGEKERIKAEKLLTSIHDAWLSMLPNLDWLDEQTRQKAVEKVNMIKHKIAYSLVSPDLRQPTSIQQYNQGLQVRQDSFYETENLVSKWYSEKTWKKAGQAVDKDEWLMSPQTANAYYSPNRNEIAIPAGIMQSSFYNAFSPEYLNYGGIGMVIGHELTHAFDSSGRKYDGRGNLVDWWTNTTSTKFEENSACFIDQYSKFNITGPNNKTVNVNGKLTLGENLADNGGVAASLSAYRNLTSNKSNVLLPGLENYSPEALFYINFGRVWCRKQREQTALQMIYVDPHSPSKARVNGLVQNSEDFARIFKCPAGSPMNPAQKCKMW